jgi:hypothetical protein
VKVIVALTALASAVLFLVDAPAAAYAIAPVICMAAWLAAEIAS